MVQPKADSAQEAFMEHLKDLRKQSKAGGGEKRIEAQHAKGKLTARERIDALLDEGSFQEINGLMVNRHTDFGMDKEKTPGDGMVAGFGKINGRRVCVYAQDFTVMGGSFGEVAGQKVCHMMDLAMDAGVPVIGFNDGGGARIQEGIFTLYAYGELVLSQYPGFWCCSPDHCHPRTLRWWCGLLPCPDRFHRHDQEYQQYVHHRS